jgi:hypothetical protein
VSLIEPTVANIRSMRLLSFVHVKCSFLKGENRHGKHFLIMDKLSDYVRRINVHPFIAFTCMDDYLAELTVAAVGSMNGV